MLAGMERALLLGKRIGRPAVTEREGFSQRFEAVVERIGPGGISRRQAARELAIRHRRMQPLSVCLTPAYKYRMRAQEKC